MVRPMSFLLSFWLATVFVVAQNGHMHMSPLLAWAVALGACFAMMGGFISPIVGPTARMIGPVLLSLGLFAVALVTLLLHVAVWFPFCVFVGTASFLAGVIAERIWSPRNRGTMAPADS